MNCVLKKHAFVGMAAGIVTKRDPILVKKTLLTHPFD
jgi:hypothetical protein